ncbi:flagellar basal body-associated FliL family protein [Sphingomonas sp. R647]|uniref:flagellar basal body-associated FliL family protein n=1 Tax=Sphingomonas sp. R647 TaxID=2875233 RepID=UPI001CD364D2|nr:flagellar basal body-associated FliL family protein [Sphingomonas sp. R647]MCA1198980.1 flagellar basal body-associated FliL family protein [Sphingomonas sp. R647]
MSDDIIVEAKDGEAPAKPKGGKKKLMIIIGAAVLVLGGGGGGAAFFLMGSDKPAAKTAEGEDGEAEAEAEAEAEGGDEKGGKDGKGGAYLDVPPLVVNLRSADGAARFLKVHIVLVPGSASTVEKLQGKLPLLIDAYQPFLRELRPEDLNGSGAVYRVKEELLVRATQTLGPNQVKDVLIQDLVQQ